MTRAEIEAIREQINFPFGVLGPAAGNALCDIAHDFEQCKARLSLLEEAGKELVRLKELHDRIEGVHEPFDNHDEAAWAEADYEKNKPLAWQALRSALSGQGPTASPQSKTPTRTPSRRQRG